MQHIIKGTVMTEPVSSATAGAVGWKLLGLGALVTSGVLGAVFMAVFDPPKDRKTQFFQAAVAGISSLICGPIAVTVVGHFFPLIDAAAAASPVQALERAAPVYLLVGALSWGVFGALAKLRQIIRERGAEEIARRTLG